MHLMIRNSNNYYLGKTILYLTLVLIAYLSSYLLKNIVITDEVITEHLSQQLSIERIDELLDFRNKWAWVYYVLRPFIYLLKFTLITLWLLSGTILFGYKTSFKELFRIVLLAEFIWLIPSFVTLIWFGFIDVDYVLLDIRYFKPLSLLNFFNPSEIESWLKFPLQSLNLFEIAYMLVLAIGVKETLKKDYIEALNFTVPVYGSALVTWIVFMTFLSINLTS